MDLIDWAERGKIPDFLIRAGIRQLCRQRLRDELKFDAERQQKRYQAMIDELRASPIAIETDAANQQHYEVPAQFYQYALGKRLKYSCCWYESAADMLEDAELAMLEKYGQRAALDNGQSILELGCGWGSLTLWMAERYPQSRITAVSNSNSQREHIEQQCVARELSNVTVLTQDVNFLHLDQAQFDRVISIEMFEHMRNYQSLMSHIADWLKPNGKLFVHIFNHRYLVYPFEVKGKDDWMSKYFFTGGLMPATDTLLHFQDDLRIEKRWLVDGRHYQRTSNHWLANMDAHKKDIIPLFKQTYGEDQAVIWFHRWRLFFLACAEFFGLNNGQEWMVGHYRFEKKN